MFRLQNLSLSLDWNEGELKQAAARALKVKETDIQRIAVGKKSIDARKKDDVHFVIGADISLGDKEAAVRKRMEKKLQIQNVPGFPKIAPQKIESGMERPVVIGLGPGGLFAALYLARCGLKPIILERGEPVELREKTVQRFTTSGTLDEESNIQFGEGGAGAFSDGKLTTGIKDARCGQVLRELADHGAPEDILILAHPHIGTDRLPGVVKSIREEILSLGGEILFRTKWTDIIVRNGEVCGIAAEGPNGSVELNTSCVLAAIGHSADDTQEMLLKKGLIAERKPFSIGFRIEHRQAMIDQSQYGRFAGHSALPAAEYKLHARLPDGRGVYTFCMCPGGTVAAAASRKGGLCVNGMSPYHRDGENANSAVLVDVRPDDFPGEDLMAGYCFQRSLEAAAFQLGGADYSAPCQLAGDFLSGRASVKEGGVHPSYRPGVRWTDLSTLFPEPWRSDLKKGLMLLDRQLPGFAAADAVLTAPETRSSCPIRYIRDAGGQSSIRGLYLVGEGAGHAGGIVSAAVDGLRCAEAAAAQD